MIYHGQMKNGVVVFDEEVSLPDGATVVVRLESTPPPSDQVPTKTIHERLKRIAGIAQDLPVDAAENLDHYLYGTPKRE